MRSIRRRARRYVEFLEQLESRVLLSGTGLITGSSSALDVPVTTPTVTLVSATDYPAATWTAANSANFTSATRVTTDVKWAIIHTTEATAAQGIATYQDPASGMAMHYLIKMDGTVVQLVRETDIAKHTGNTSYDNKSIGIAVERFGANAITAAEYAATANLIHWLARRWAIPEVIKVAGIDPFNPNTDAGITAENRVPDPNNFTLGGGANHATDPINWDWNALQTALGVGVPAISSISPSAGIKVAEDFTVDLSINAPGTSVVLSQARLTLPGGTQQTFVPDLNGSFVLSAGANDHVSKYNIPARLSPGAYHLTVQLWTDVNGNGVVDAGDTPIGSGAEADIAVAANQHPAISSLVWPSGPLTGDVAMTYTLSDAESDIGALVVEYSTDGGITWHAATSAAGGNGASNLATSPIGVGHTFVWNSMADVPQIRGAIMLRLTPDDAAGFGAPALTGSIEVDNDQLPVLGNLTTASAVTRWLPLTMNLSSATDSDGTVSRVEFWAELTGAGLDRNADWFLGADTNGADGWSITVPLALFSGSNVTLYAVAMDNAGYFSNPVQLDAPVTAASNLAAPTGTFGKFTNTSLVGWAFDSDFGANPIDVLYQIDANPPVRATANVDRPDLAFLGSTAHGFKINLSGLSNASHTATVWAIDPMNQKLVLLGTRTLPAVVGGTNQLPVGVLGAKTSATRLVGWGRDPNTTSSIFVRYDVDGIPGIPFLANVHRADLSAPQDVGFDVPLSLSPGEHRLDVYLFDAQTNAPVLLGSKIVNAAIPAGTLSLINSNTIAQGTLISAAFPTGAVGRLVINKTKLPIFVANQTIGGVGAGNAFSFALPAGILVSGDNTVTLQLVDTLTLTTVDITSVTVVLP